MYDPFLCMDTALDTKQETLQIQTVQVAQITMPKIEQIQEMRKKDTVPS